MGVSRFQPGQPRLRSLLYIVVLISSFSGSSYAKHQYGTQNGYDNGGDAAICWASNIQTNSTVSESDIQTLDSELFSERGKLNSSSSILQSCPNGTALEVKVLDLINGNSMLMETEHKVEIELYIDRSVLDISENSNASSVFIRFLLCDASRVGFCNPFDGFDDFELNGSDRPPPPPPSDGSSPPPDGDTPPPDGSRPPPEGAPPPPDGSRPPQYRTRGLGEEEKHVLTATAVDKRYLLTEYVEMIFENKQVEEKNHSNMIELESEVTLILPKVAAGLYFVVGHVVFSFTSDDGASISRLDVANTIEGNTVELFPRPTVKRVTTAMVITLSVFIAICSTAFLWLFCFIMKNLQHDVLRLAQGNFLALIVLCSFFSASFSFTNLPLKDIFCQMNGSLVLVPITCIGATLTARLWRVYMMLATASGLGKDQTKTPFIDLGSIFVDILTFFARKPICVRKPQMRGRSLRENVTNAETTCLIFMLTFPQLALQLFGALYFDRVLDIELSPGRDTGKEVCEESALWIALSGFGIAALPFITAVWMAWLSRDLPSAFNEKTQVFNAASSSAFIAFVSLSLMLMTSDATISPNLNVLLRSLFSLGVPINVISYIVWPKIARILSGEKVVMSNLLQAKYSRSTTESEANNPSRNPSNLSFQDHIKVKKDDPIPSNIESKIHGVHKLLSRVRDRCVEGRTLTETEWQEMQREVARLKMELDKIQLDWTDGGQESADSSA